MTTYTHTIANGYCTVCADTAEWLESRNQSCHYIVKASDINAGDYIQTTTFNGMKHASIAVSYVTRDGDTINLHGAQTTYTHHKDDTLTIQRG